MVASFFGKAGHLSTSVLANRCTVTSEWYTSVALSDLFTAVQQRRPKSGLRDLLLHHDNAPAHTSAKTLDFLLDHGVRLMTHPAYSPDLSPCDFFLFPKLKSKMRGRQFESPEAAVVTYQELLEGLEKDDFKK